MPFMKKKKIFAFPTRRMIFVSLWNYLQQLHSTKNKNSKVIKIFKIIRQNYAKFDNITWIHIVTRRASAAQTRVEVSRSAGRLKRARKIEIGPNRVFQKILLIFLEMYCKCNIYRKSSIRSRPLIQVYSIRSRKV